MAWGIDDPALRHVFEKPSLISRKPSRTKRLAPWRGWSTASGTQFPLVLRGYRLARSFHSTAL